MHMQLLNNDKVLCSHLKISIRPLMNTCNVWGALSSSCLMDHSFRLAELVKSFAFINHATTKPVIGKRFKEMVCRDGWYATNHILQWTRVLLEEEGRFQGLGFIRRFREGCGEKVPILEVRSLSYQHWLQFFAETKMQGMSQVLSVEVLVCGGAPNGAC
ncbi:hypothetical protein Leryth_020908 [Lithospermum erythrorhizon]|nr:hypothetical protein Leryth_020908 [Lithospermum erythrorhizon]